MRRTILSVFLLLICLAAVPTTAGVNYWSPIGPNGGTVRILRAAPRNSSLLYAATTGGVFRSTDGGAHWVRASHGLSRNDVAALAVAPSNPSVLYASTGFDVFVSRNGGDTWSFTEPLGIRYVAALAVDPRNPRWVWAGTRGGPFWSHDGGAHWHEVADTHADFIAEVWAFAFDPVHPDTMYMTNLANEDYGENTIAKSTDGGKTWKRRNVGLEDLDLSGDTQLTLDPTAPNVIYGCFIQFPEDPNSIDWQYVSYRSTDGAATWKATPGGFPLAVDRRGVVYAGNRRSSNHGATWQQFAAPPDFPLTYAASAAGNGTIWAGTVFSGVFRSGDGGATWQPASSGLHATPVTSIAVNPGQPSVLYATMPGLGISKTVNAGLSWQPANTGLPAELFEDAILALDPRQPETAYLSWSSQTSGFARSDDGGKHWTLLPGVLYRSRGLVADPAAPGVIYLTGYGLSATNEPCDLARSDDRGLTRRCLLPPENDLPRRLVLDPATPGKLWLLEGSILRKSMDRGESWTQIQPLGLEHAGVPRSLLIDPAHPGVLYMGTEHYDRNELSRIWRSDDGGLHWLPWGSGVPQNSSITDLLIDPQQPSILYAAVVQQIYDFFDRSPNLSGVYQSRDGGQTFTPLRDGLPGAVQQLILDPANPRLLYAATPHDGFYSFTRVGR